MYSTVPVVDKVFISSITSIRSDHKIDAEYVEEDYDGLTVFEVEDTDKHFVVWKCKVVPVEDIPGKLDVDIQRKEIVIVCSYSGFAYQYTPYDHQFDVRWTGERFVVRRVT